MVYLVYGLIPKASGTERSSTRVASHCTEEVDLTKTMKRNLAIVCLGLVFGATAPGQTPAKTVDQQRAGAVAVAGKEFQRMLYVICPPASAPAPQQTAAAPANAPREPAVPPRSEWYAEPAKVFDNLYFVGTQAN